MENGDKQLFRRLDDLIRLCGVRAKPQFYGFLDERQRELVREYVRSAPVFCTFFGGYETAERTFVCVSETMDEGVEFPLAALEFTFRKADVLTHRDFLGALMSLGIKRESVGDILTEEGRALVFLEEAVCAFVLPQLTKIGRVGVKVKKTDEFQLPKQGEIEIVQGIVSSIRLDTVVNVMTHLSREKSKQLIMAGLVKHNFEFCDNPSKPVASGDRISARGYGKFTLASVGSPTKKGKYHIVLHKHI